MKIGYYPGCSLERSGREFSLSLEQVLSTLGVETVQIEDWSCCGASSAHMTNHELASILSGRNLLLAGKQGLNQVLAPCAACYNRLICGQDEIKKNPKLKAKVEEELAEKFGSNVEIINILQLLHTIGKEQIAAKKQKDLKGLKVACYYGCLLLRPWGITHFDDPEQPGSMEEILSATGVETVDWNFKTECCGAAHSIAHTDIVFDLSKKILDDARGHEADAIVTACPMCHSNLDMRQVGIKSKYSGHKDMPVFYITELIGMALGIDRKKLGIHLHFIDARPVTSKIELGAAV